MADDERDRKEAFDRLEKILNSKTISDQGEVAKFLDQQYVKHYERDMDFIRKEAPDTFTKFIMKHMQKLDRNSSIIDIGAGTGLLGEKLKAFGFTNLFGHDGSSAMLEIAKERKIYNRLYQEVLIEDTPSNTMNKQGFDVLVSLGAFAIPTQMNERHFEALVDLVKPGGLLLVGFGRTSFNEKFQAVVTNLAKKCTLIEEEIVKNYLQIRDTKSGEVIAHDGIYIAFKIA